MEKKKDLQSPTVCFGSPIVKKYRYNRFDFTSKILYYTKCLLKDRKQLSVDIKIKKIIKNSIKYGYYMIDTSRAYGGSEYAIGKALKNIDRNEFYVVSKISNSAQFNDNVRASMLSTLKELDMEYIDLCLLHWPVENIFLDSWEELIKLRDEGLCKEIGVCNCNIHHLQKIYDKTGFYPAVNQFECHPLFTQKELVEFCKSNNITIMGYTATARMDERLFKTCLTAIAKKYDKSIAQIILKWHLQNSIIPIVSTTDMKHLKDNINIYDFTLSDDEMSQIDKININSRLRYDPDNCDFNQL